MKPRIAIPIPTTIDLPYNARAWPMYAKAITAAGGEPVEIPLNLLTSQLLALARTCHGLCLPGSPADVDPTRYAAEIDPATAPKDSPREAVDFLLLDEAAQRALPVLGICYGVQSLNVWRGGTLVQDLTPVPVNHAAGSKVAIAHTALVAKDSLLGSLLTPGEAPAAPEQENFLRLPINTSHHQAVATPGEGLRIVARSPEDGVIEAVENDPGYRPAAGLPPQLLLGIQWHPERSYDISAASRAFFARLITEAANFAVANRTHVSN